MKTLLLTTASLIILCFNTLAEAPAKNTEQPFVVPALPVLTGNPDEEAPVELKSLLANPSAVTVAPMNLDNPDEEAPAELKDMPAYPAVVPIAPMSFGNPDEAPFELGSMPAYAVK